MRKLFALIVVFCVGYSEQATYTLPQNHKHPGKTPFCIDETEGKKSVGETWYVLDKCESRYCRIDFEGKTHISGASCGAVGVPANCKLVKPPGSKLYPECCPRPECEGEESILK